MENPSPDAWVMAKALAAAAAGRALLILDATRRETPSLAKLFGIVLYEIPLVCAFALLGWHAAAILGASADEYRITITVVLAWSGQRGIDLILQRIWPPKT